MSSINEGWVFGFGDRIGSPTSPFFYGSGIVFHSDLEHFMKDHCNYRLVFDPKKDHEMRKFLEGVEKKCMQILAMSGGRELLETDLEGNVIRKITFEEQFAKMFLEEVVAFFGVPLKQYQRRNEQRRREIVRRSIHLRENSRKSSSQSPCVFLGELKGCGFCLERSLLYKIVCDIYKVKCRVLQGELRDKNRKIPVLGHMWNEVEIEGGKRIVVVDAMNRGSFADDEHCRRLVNRSKSMKRNEEIERNSWIQRLKGNFAGQKKILESAIEHLRSYSKNPIDFSSRFRQLAECNHLLHDFPSTCESYKKASEFLQSAMGIQIDITDTSEHELFSKVSENPFMWEVTSLEFSYVYFGLGNVLAIHKNEFRKAKNMFEIALRIMEEMFPKETRGFAETQHYKAVLIALGSSEMRKVGNDDDNVSKMRCVFCKISKEENKGVMKRCSGCKKVIYCCKEHQVRHWKVHKKVCRKL